jgi:hypothetical protein
MRRTAMRATDECSATTHAKLHVSNQKTTGLLLKHSYLDVTFQALPFGEGVPKQPDGFRLPNLKGGTTAHV